MSDVRTLKQDAWHCSLILLFLCSQHRRKIHWHNLKPKAGINGAFTRLKRKKEERKKTVDVKRYQREDFY